VPETPSTAIEAGNSNTAVTAIITRHAANALDQETPAVMMNACSKGRCSLTD